ncbi:methyltransferase [Embleya sp. NBC_00896]|uniref:methyltransferase n=1 Tax=Embleya sp. NBC_00896 TaxID=2975961 RepID=UPI002F90BCA2|nr:acetylserotonin O-methyltransferase [Embleya sp. NBC_00896]
MTAEVSAPPVAPPLPSPDYIMQLAFGFSAAKCLLSAVETGVFSELAGRQGQDAAELGARLGLHPRAARDFLDTLVALGLLDRHDGRYANTVQASVFLDRAKPTYIGDGLDMVNARLYGFWGHLTDALRTGETQNEAKSAGTAANPFAIIYADPARRRLFLRAMSQLSRPTMLALAERFPWARYESVVDLGCGDGALLCHIAARHPHLTGVGFDLPESADAFAEHVGEEGLAARIGFRAGDFFTDPLPTAHVLVLGHVLHDWDPAAKRRLLAAAHAALPEDGAVVVFESFLDDDRRTNLPGLLLGLNTLIETPGGSACTVAECRRLLVEAGFRDVRAEPLAGSESMVVGVK